MPSGLLSDTDESVAQLMAAVDECPRDGAAGESALARHVQLWWSVGELSGLLNHDDADVGRAAARCLGVVGKRSAILPLGRALHHDEPSVAEEAEDALWRVWFGEAGVAARRRLSRAVQLMREGRCEAAVDLLTELIRDEPDFAEAYHQRSLAYSLCNEPLRSIADCHRAVRLNPIHFSAWANMGHAHAQLGQMADALRCYRKTLEVHPRMEGIRQAIRRIRAVQSRHI